MKPLSGTAGLIFSLFLVGCVLPVPINQHGYMPAGPGELQEPTFAFFSCKNVKYTLRIQADDGFQLSVRAYIESGWHIIIPESGNVILEIFLLPAVGTTVQLVSSEFVIESPDYENPMTVNVLSIADVYADRRHLPDALLTGGVRRSAGLFGGPENARYRLHFHDKYPFYTQCRACIPHLL